MSSGILYVALGASYQHEAMVSAESVRRHNPDAAITLVTDCHTPEVHPFSRVKTVAQPQPGRIPALLRTVEILAEGLPYERTIFLDTDTFVAGSLDPLFGLLDFVDLAAVLAPNGHVEGVPTICGTEIAAADIFNSGVLAFSRGGAVEELLIEWRDRLHRRIREGMGPWEGDQRALMEAVLTSRCRVQSVSAVWNFRTPFFVSVTGRVRIFHGREPDFPEIEAEVNRSESNRSWDPHDRMVHVFDPTRVRRIDHYGGVSAPLGPE